MSIRRFLVSALLGLLAGCFTLFVLRSTGDASGHDLSWPLLGARELLAGNNPYVSIHPYQWLSPLPEFWPLYYPLPALLAVLPLSLLPLQLAAVLFIALSFGLLAWSLYPQPHRLLVLISFPAVYAAYHVQWSPLTTAAALLGWWPLLLAKPTVGLPLLLLYRPTSRHGWLLLALGALVLLASVPLGWLDNTRQHVNVQPLLVLPWGPLLLLPALLRWKDQRVWFLLALALMPQRTGVDQLALGLVARSPRGMLLWTIASWCSVFMVQLAGRELGIVSLYLAALLVTLYDRDGVSRRDAAVAYRAARSWTSAAARRS